MDVSGPPPCETLQGPSSRPNPTTHGVTDPKLLDGETKNINLKIVLGSLWCWVWDSTLGSSKRLVWGGECV